MLLLLLLLIALVLYHSVLLLMVCWCYWTVEPNVYTHFEFSVILILGFDVAVSLCDFPCFSCCNWRGFRFKLECCCIQKLLIPINMLKSISFCVWFLLGFLVSFIGRKVIFACICLQYTYRRYEHGGYILCLNRKQWKLSHYFSATKNRIRFHQLMIIGYMKLNIDGV